MSASQAGMGAQGGGGLLGVYGTIKQGQAAFDAGKYNAQNSSFNAGASADEGAILLNRSQRNAAQIEGSTKAEYSASGIDVGQGSAMDVLQQNAQQAALDSHYLTMRTANKVLGYQRSANQSLYEGNQARINSYYSAAGQLLQSGAQIAAAGGA